MNEPTVIVLMGVSGSGKTTIGRLLSKAIHWQFYDGDNLHPEKNIIKMTQGIALTDNDRKPWLETLQSLINKIYVSGRSAIIACSALKRSYREYLLKDNRGVLFIHLKGNYELIKERLSERQGHYMNASLLGNQFDTLEEPEGVFTIDILQKPEVTVASIKKYLNL